MIGVSSDFVNSDLGVSLDLFSTSQTNDPKQAETKILFCIKNAPIICIPPNLSGFGLLYQSCCNDWTCPKCGQTRAKQEYGRIVEGARTLAQDHKLYWGTMTCRGKKLSLSEAEQCYLTWTNRALTGFRTHTVRAKGFWSYASVTERQPGRGHPHSHFLLTSVPSDTFAIVDDYERYTKSVHEIGVCFPEMRWIPEAKETFSHLDLHSEWFVLNCAKSGLGVQARLSEIDSPEGVSRYMSKYLFKQLNQDQWRKGWKRVRYSQNFPQLPEVNSQNAFPLRNLGDWRKVRAFNKTMICDTITTSIMSAARGVYDTKVKN